MAAPCAVGKRLGNRRGMALLLVISVISLLTVVIVQFNRSMQSAMTSAGHYQYRERLEAAVQSGIDIGCAVLVADRRIDGQDTLIDPWALLVEQNLGSLADSAELQVSITDLAGRLPINGLVADTAAGETAAQQLRQVLRRLLLSGRFAIDDEQQVRDIIDSLVDWLDGDDDEQPFGAERAYYQALEPPYQPANGPFLFVEELLWVKGISPEILFGNDEKDGLADYITVDSADHRININTAPVPVLLGLDERIDDVQVEQIDRFRRQPENRQLLGDPSWYHNVPGWPAELHIAPELITAASSHFLITAVAADGAGELTATAVVRRENERELEVIFFRME